MLKNLIIKIARTLRLIGINIKDIYALKNYFRFRRDRKEWLRQGGKITKTFMLLQDYSDNAGQSKGHYFHQDLLVAKMIYDTKPKRHVDIGSRLDGFVAHVASFREIEVIDIRPLEKSSHQNIKFLQADMMNPLQVSKTDSLSCLHAIEHFGLGRYNDPIDIDGHIRGISNLVSMLEKNGILYLSFPIGKKDEVHFNAHRIFHPKSIFNNHIIRSQMELIRFDYVDDQGDLHLESNVELTLGKLNYGCGIYTFKKLNNL
tara:strand:- start:22 stop:798 length:777 start_codon:yes stop_codon:yes gene_type:complete